MSSATRFALAALPLAEIVLAPPAAAAQQRRYAFDIPAGPAGASLAAVATTTGTAIGWTPAVALLRLPGLRGTMSSSEALRRLLGGSGYRAVRAGPSAYRIVPGSRTDPFAARPAAATARPAVAARPSLPLPGEIVVTGQKRRQLLRQLPTSISVVDLSSADARRPLPASRDVALAIEGLAITNLGPGRNRQFIRGVADSPFNGPSQSTVAIQLDEARITFDAPDPDLRLVDVQQVEVLKGPQGPLYGSGALGGIYHVVTRKPDLAAAGGSVLASAEAVEHGGVGGEIEAVVNLPLVTDTLALRAVGYRAREGGWIDNIGRNRNANATDVVGGRLALRWQPDVDWTIDLSGIVQNVDTRDSQYVTASKKTVQRIANAPEPTDNDFRSAGATVRGRLGGVELLVATSRIEHAVEVDLDSTPASALFGLTGPSQFSDVRNYSIVNHEVRLSPAGSTRWLIGASYLSARSHSIATVAGATASVVAETLDRRVHEIAVFGELTLPIFDRIDVTTGARLFRTLAEDEAAELSGAASYRIAKVVLSPSIALSWRASPADVLYLRYARALRPGGLAPSDAATSRRFDSDELGTLDLGVRHSGADGRLSLTASVFHTVWDHIQSDYLLPNGLVSTRNAGRGRITGIEASGAWRPRGDLQLSAGAAYTDAHLTHTETGIELDDLRLPITPDVTARAAIRYSVTVDEWTGILSGQANYVGRARLTFDSALDRDMGGYATVATIASLSRGALSLGAKIDNLLDIKGDSFAFGNPFSILEGRQFTPLRPRTFTLSIARSW